MHRYFGELIMQKIKVKVSASIGAAILTGVIVAFVEAEEKIIQQEQISFEKCIEVITKSQNKLSIAPEISDVSDQKRIAVFTLSDGVLKITCDRVEGNVTVSTDMY